MLLYLSYFIRIQGLVNKHIFVFRYVMSNNSWYHHLTFYSLTAVRMEKGFFFSLDLPHLGDWNYNVCVACEEPPSTKLSAKVQQPNTTCSDLWPSGKPCYSIWLFSFSCTVTHAVYPERLTVASAAHLLPTRVVQGWTSNLTLIRPCWWCSSSHRAPKDVTASAESCPSFFKCVIYFKLGDSHPCYSSYNSQFPPRQNSQWPAINRNKSQ